MDTRYDVDNATGTHLRETSGRGLMRSSVMNDAFDNDVPSDSRYDEVDHQRFDSGVNRNSDGRQRRSRIIDTRSSNHYSVSPINSSSSGDNSVDRKYI
jgi:hypothetical protein